MTNPLTNMSSTPRKSRRAKARNPKSQPFTHDAQEFVVTSATITRNGVPVTMKVGEVLQVKPFDTIHVTAIPALPGLTWTRTVPTVDGWYWVRFNGAFSDGFWELAGPIAPPA